MHALKQHARTLALTLARDESGGEVIEYALILGLILVITIATIAACGTRVLARWQSVNSSM